MPSALLIAIVAGLFSVMGGYFGAGIQARHVISQKLLEYRVGAYGSFLDKIDRSKAPALSQILSVGAMVDHLATDWEIQSFENRIAILLKNFDSQDLYWQLNADANILRVHGSPRVAEILDDILKALLLRDAEIDWANYSPEVAGYYRNWKAGQETGTTYGLHERVSGDERLMVVIVAKLMQVLVQQLRLEIQSVSP